MTYLITQTFVLLLIAALLGMLLGWYLTRISAASTKTSLLTRLRNAENESRKLKTELDAALATRTNCEAECKSLVDQLAAAKAELGSATDNSEQVAELEAQLAECRVALEQASETAIAATEAAAEAADPVAADTGASGQPLLAGNDEAADNLQEIKGIGPKIAGILNDLGIRRFDQIAAWTPENIEWVNERLKFKGRIERESWIPQAKALMKAKGG